jgi:threonine dehydratase
MDSAAAERRIRAFVRETPLEPSPALGAATGARVFLKLENRQETGAFKLRGAANKLLSMPKEAAARGIVTASTGNHALAVSTIAGKLGIPVEIFVSEHIHPYKRKKIEALGARINAVAGDALFAELEARRESERSGRPYVSPYNDSVVIEGQGTVAVEILRQVAAQGEPQLDAVFVAVGGGGLIGGMGAYLKRVSPTTQVVACWPENSRAMYECLNAGAIIDVPEQPTYSTSTAGGVEPGAITLAICQAAIDRKLLVTEAEILDAARRLERGDGELVEGAAAVAVAAFLKSAGDYTGKSVALLLCGGNAEPEFAERVREA